jgi:hypothetical protein
MDIPISSLMILASLGLQQTAPAQPTVEPKNESRVAQSSSPVTLPKSAQYKLKSLGIRIAIPAYLPSGYRYQTVVTEPCRSDIAVNADGVCRFGPSYSIVYINANKNCFVVEATGGGVGGATSDYIHSFSTPLFNQETLISFGNMGMSSGIPKKATASDLRKTYDVVYGNWMGESPFYRVSTFYPKSVTACTSRKGLTPLEAQKVTQSLRWLP